MGLTQEGSWASKTLLQRHPKGSGSLLSLAGVLGTLQPGETPASSWSRQIFSSSVWKCLLIHFIFFFAVTHFLLEHTEEGSRLQAGEMLPDPCSTRESSCLLFPSQGDWRIISLLDDSPIPALLLCEFSCCYINVSSSQCSQLQWHKGSVNITSREEIPFEKGLFYSLVTHVIAFICCNEIFHKSSLHGLAPFSIAQLPGIFLLAK